MEEILKNIKELNIAKRCAGEFDYCPGPDQAQYVVDNLFNYDIEKLKDILNTYKGTAYDSFDDMLEMHTQELITATQSLGVGNDGFEFVEGYPETQDHIRKLYLPIDIFYRDCPHCGYSHEFDFNGEDYLHYPKLNQEVEMIYGCGQCGNDFTFNYTIHVNAEVELKTRKL